MRISTSHINRSVIEVIKRFPIVILMIIATVVALIVLIEEPDGYENDMIKLALSCSLGIVAFLNSKLYKEQYNIDKIGYYVINGLVFGFLLIYFFLLPDNIEDDQAVGIQFAGILLFLHLMASYLPYIKSKKSENFSIYNIQVFLRFLESLLFVLVLFATVSLAIVAIENLFEIELMKGMRYLQLFVVLAGIIGSFYLLSAYPKKFNDIGPVVYNKAFAVFPRYILIPIVFVYGLILYAYAIKLIIVKTWPEEWMITMSVWFFVIGILSFLLNYAYNSQYKNNWSRAFLKSFFPISIPLALALIIPVYKRFLERGITEHNYSLAALIIWVIFISIYIIVSKRDSIKILPISMSIIALFSVIGPWNMSTLSINNQWSRLEFNLAEIGSLDNQSALIQVDTLLDYEVFNSIEYSLSYILDHNGLEKVISWDKNGILSDKIGEYSTAYLIMSDIGITRNSSLGNTPPFNSKHFDFEGNDRYSLPLDSFDYFIPIIEMRIRPKPEYCLYLDNEMGKFVLIFNDKESFFEVPAISQLDLSYMANDGMIPSELMIENEAYRILIKFHFINGIIIENGIRKIERIRGNAFIRIK